MVIGRRSLCVAAALLFGIGGCGADKPTPDAEASAVRAQMAWDSSQEQYKDVQAIENRLVRKCLTDQGFDVFPAEPPASDEPQEGPRLVSPEPGDAARAGYGLDPRGLPKPATPSDGSSYEQTPDSYKARLTRAKYGADDDLISFTTSDGTKVEIPHHGCLGDVRTRLFGDLKEYLRLSFTADNLVGQGRSAGAEDDPGFVKAAGQWRECIEKAGYSGIQSTKDMRDKARRLYEGIDQADTRALDAAVAAEIKIAGADAACAKSSGLNQAYAAARSKGATKSLVAHEADMVAWDALVRKALQKGQELLKA
ncbi:hypothetical protein [Krasilnikovia sp. M28-CT-15]|uniref:hypothetical protein n=1 Tax=Krasilnikovia sp. M28-CT-15 TaxID=3373540 RepID=UPI0038760D72